MASNRSWESDNNQYVSQCWGQLSPIEQLLCLNDECVTGSGPCNGKLMFPLCRTCAKQENQLQTCTHKIDLSQGHGLVLN